jgi:hypothetical protein
LAWANNDLMSAEDYYLRPEKRDGAVFRGNKDWDRLIKLAFHKSEWKHLIDLVLQANIRAFGNDIVLGSSGTSRIPYLKMVALAIAKCGIQNDLGLADKISKLFAIDKNDLKQLICSVSSLSDKELSNLQNKALPRVTKTRNITYGDALKKGDTYKASLIAKAIISIDTACTNAIEKLHFFFKEGSETALTYIAETINDFYDESLANTFLRTLTSKVFESLNDSCNYRLVVKFYESHPLIRRLYFGDLLKLKFQHNIRINPSDIYTGLLQHISSIAVDIAEMSPKNRRKKPLLEFSKLIAFSDWIEMKLEIWLNTEGASSLQRVISIWNTQVAKPVQSPFDVSKHAPNNPREMIEWVDLLEDFHVWITKCWLNEIGVERWKSEKSVLDIVNKYFKSFEVLRHAQPIWIEPQHLDIYIPEISLAIEYMGEQHYRPVEHFGGEQGFQNTVYRDQRKAEICKKAGINLVYIRFDDNIKKKIEEIKNTYAG